MGALTSWSPYTILSAFSEAMRSITMSETNKSDVLMSATKSKRVPSGTVAVDVVVLVVLDVVVDVLGVVAVELVISRVPAEQPTSANNVNSEDFAFIVSLLTLYLLSYWASLVLANWWFE
jgi:hypothetical protein